MSVINPAAHEIAAKVVFYGPGLSGKTTTLQRIHSSVRPERRGDLISLATETDRTIFFDFLPVHAQSVRGLSVRFQLYTVPGQVFYAATRKLVLTGADGVVFVADSQESCADRNVESFESLRENLTQLDIDIEHFPIVLQFNKRDLPTAMPVPAMSGMLNFIDAPEFPTNAATGDGIVSVLRAITQRVVSSVTAQQPAPERAGVESARQKQRPAKPEPIGIASSVSAATASQKQRPSRSEPDGIASSISAATARLAPVRAVKSASPTANALDGSKGWTIVPGPVTEPPVHRASVPSAKSGVSFAPLCPAERAEAVRSVERLITSGDFASGVSGAAKLLAELIDDLPTPHGTDRAAKAVLLGIDGREYLRVCRLATAPRERLSERDVLLALHVLVSAYRKAADI
jgi:signal recognition particle receptor subunit beta